jgi:hypothetical protein
VKVLRPRTWFPVKGVTMCILYNFVACCDSKSQHCTLLETSLIQWFTILIVTECWDLTIVRLSLLIIGQIAWAKKIWAKHDWEHDLLTWLGDCYTSAQHFSLSWGSSDWWPEDGLRRGGDITITGLILRERRNDVYLI